MLLQALIQFELKRLSEGSTSLLDDPSAVPDLSASAAAEEASANGGGSNNSGSPAGKGMFGWWNQLTNNVKRVFVKGDGASAAAAGAGGGDAGGHTLDFDVVLAPDAKWGFSLDKVDASQVGELH